jgi:hypothetical protein
LVFQNSNFHAHATIQTMVSAPCSHNSPRWICTHYRWRSQLQNGSKPTR